MKTLACRWLLPIILLLTLTVPGAIALTEPGWETQETRTLIISPLTETSCRLAWTRLPGEGRWRILAASNPYALTDEWQTLMVTDRLEVELTGLPGERYFKVIAEPGYYSHDEVEWLNFETVPELLSYATQDSEPDGWELTLGGGDGGNALRFLGNTWKVLELDPPKRITRDFCAGVSVFRERKSEWQAIGFRDTSNHVVWFTLGGKETLWGDSIYNSWSEVPPYSQWTRWRMPVGETFTSYFRRNGMCNAIVFANDNDTVRTDGIWRVDRITDASGDQFETPRFTIQVQRQSDLVYNVQAFINDENIEQGTVKWDGDAETNATGSFATLRFRHGGLKQILCRWQDIDRVERWAWATINIPGSDVPKQPFTYCGVGDIMIARRFESEGLINTYGVDGLFNNVRSYLNSFDLVTGNTECAYSNSGVQHPNKTYTFKGRPSYVGAIVRAGIDVASLANNHTGDYGDEALKETFDNYEANGLHYTGAGANDGEAWRPAIVNRGGQRIAIFGYCSLTGREQNQAPYLEAAPNKGGFSWGKRELIAEHFAKVRPLVDLIIVQYHIGYIEYTNEPDQMTQPSSVRDWNDWDDDTVVDTNGIAIADYMLEHGADLVIGHGPHVPQAVVARPGNKYIAYSTGNFLFDQYLPETFQSISFEADVNRFSEVREARIRPIYVDNYMPGVASGRLGVKILNHIASLSRERGTTLVEPSDGALTRIIASDNLYFDRVVLPPETLTVPFRTVGTYQVAAPYMFPDTGIVEQVWVMRNEAESYEYRLGMDQLWGIGNMEDEGAPTTWVFENGESIDDSLSFAGDRSLRIRRSSGTGTMTVQTFRRYVVDRNIPYTLHARIWPGAIAGSNIRLDYWRGRTGNEVPNPSTQVLLSQAAGTQWVEDFADATIPENTSCLQIRCRLAAGSATTSYFDDVAFIQWGQNWTAGQLVTLPNPHRWTHLQIRTNDLSVTSTRVIVQRARLVARPR
ncbi:MAG: CapA family protein [bacterium]|nr:CapA family protein [bacterium]